VRLLRVAAAGVAAVAALAGAWLLVGSAWAARREREADRAFDEAFGPRAALEAKYGVAASNAEALKAEELARAVGFDLRPRKGRDNVATTGTAAPNADRVAIGDYVKEQVARADDAVPPPPAAAAAVLESRRVALSALEDSLVTRAAPRWAFDPHVDYEERLVPNALGHIQIQRLLIADALSRAARREDGAAARALEASWKLNEGLTSRPEIVSELVAIAVARYEAGALRMFEASADAWTPRLAAMGSRALLVDGLVLQHRTSTNMLARIRSLRPEGVGWWAHNLVSVLQEPGERLAWANYGKDWARSLAELRDEPAFRERAPDPKPGWSTSAVIMSITVPNIRNSFERADRLALEAELTGKILRARAARAATGAWPPPSSEIAASRFPGLTWNYAVDGGAMKIALNGELPPLKSPLVLPTSFSAKTP